MKNDDTTSSRPEIVIVRRRGGDDGGGGKGGAWKIAYADFVTAMMAFFLVMWLINASNEETRAQVASYFNPIKLTDTTTGARSLKDTKDARNSQSSQSGRSGGGSPPSEEDVRREAELLSNPPESLDRIAGTASPSEFKSRGLEIDIEIAPALRPDTSNPGVGDPFDPRAWEKVRAASQPAVEDTTEAEAAAKKESGKLNTEQTQIDAKESPAATPVMQSNDSGRDIGKAEAEAAAIAQEIAARLGPASKDLPRSLTVAATQSGILISLTESENFEMFETGSAEPRPEAQKMVEAIVSAVQFRDGYLVIRGHTDSRPYRNRYYDNWQLSTARAHFARYMLVRGGLDETRIHRIEGVADREPRNREDPQAAENRRIEILIGNTAP